MSQTLSSPPTDPKPPARRRRAFPWLSERPETRSVQIGVAGTILVHLILFLLAPRLLRVDQVRSLTRPHLSPHQLNIEMDPGLFLSQQKPPPKPPMKFVEANPNAPENIPDRTNNFSDRNQQAAQEKPTPNGKSDMPKLEGRKDIQSTQIVTGQLSPPQQMAPTPPPAPIAPKTPSMATPRREQNPLPGFDQKQGESIDGFGANLAKPNANAQPTPDKVEGSKDAPLIENAFNGTPQIDPQHPRPRRTVESHVRPAIFRDNQFGTSNVGITALDSRFSNYGVYLKRLLEAVQLNWYAILDQSRISPASGSQVAVRFKLTSKGEVSAIIEIAPTPGTSEQGTRACARAITVGAPYGEWSDDMKQVLGDEQELAITFLYL